MSSLIVVAGDRHGSLVDGWWAAEPRRREGGRGEGL